MKACFVALISLSLGLQSCNTYRTTEVPDGGTARGYPFVFSKTFKAEITYSDSSTSVNLVAVPTLFAVDTERAAIGTTKTEFENGTDGFALKAKTDLDQKVPENVEAITALLKQLGVTVAGAPAAPGSPSPAFIPDLDPNKTPVSIKIMPLTQ